MARNGFFLGMQKQGANKKCLRVIFDYDLLNAKDAVKKILKSKLLAKRCKHENDFFLVFIYSTKHYQMGAYGVETMKESENNEWNNKEGLDCNRYEKR